MAWQSQGRVLSGAALVAAVVLCLHAQQPGHRIVFTRTPLKGGAEQLALLLPGGAVRSLATAFHSSADPDVSFDGKRILFAARKTAADRWQVYEMLADGTGARQITREPMDCRNPVYQSKIYSLSIEDPWYQVTFTGTRDGQSSLYSVMLDGSGLRRLTYNPFGDMDPYQMPDGRILFAGRQPGRVSLFGINLDGTDFALFSGPEGKANKRMPCVTAGRLAVFVEPEGADGGGTLATVSLRRNLHSYRQITRPQDGRFHSPSPLNDGRILVSRRRGRGPYEIMAGNPETGGFLPIYSDPAFHATQAKAAVAREEPDGRASVVDEKETTGKFYCLSVYTGDLGSPNWIEPGTAKRVRVVEAYTPDLKTRLLGEFDLDADGSFHVQTPANTPLQFQVLDAEGMALRSSTWIWNKNKEQRGCIGCHEDGESTPENRFAQALARPAVQLTLPPERRRTLEFARDIEPVLKAKCNRCHAARPLDMKSLVRPGEARTSPLVWSILGRNTSRPWDTIPKAAVRPMPPAGSPPLTAEEKRAIVEWIDLGGKL